MIKISQELDMVDASALVERYNLFADSYCKVFKEEQDGQIIGAGVLNLDINNITLDLKVDTDDFIDRDLLFRSMLNSITLLENNFLVVVSYQQAEYVGGKVAMERLGFVNNNVNYEIYSKDIKFNCGCN